MVVRRPTILVAWVQRLHFFRRLAPRPVPVFRHLIKVLHATLAVNRYCHRDAPKRYGPVTGDEHKFTFYFKTHSGHILFGNSGHLPF